MGAWEKRPGKEPSGVEEATCSGGGDTSVANGREVEERIRNVVRRRGIRDLTRRGRGKTVINTAHLINYRICLNSCNPGL